MVVGLVIFDCCSLSLAHDFSEVGGSFAVGYMRSQFYAPCERNIPNKIPEIKEESTI